MYCKYTKFVEVYNNCVNYSMATTRQIGYVTTKSYNISKIVLVSLVVIIGIILTLNNVAILTYHGLMASSDILAQNGAEYNFTVSIFIAPCVIFFFACVAISIFLNVSFPSLTID